MLNSQFTFEVFLKVLSVEEAEAIVEKLWEYVDDPCDLIESSVNEEQSIVRYFKDEKQAEEWYEILCSFGFQNVEIGVKSLEDKDWKDKWKEDFRPFSLTDKFFVIPVWEKETAQVPLGMTSIYIDTSLAFGTGLHETTRFMSEMIQGKENQFKSFLDVGTGTGMLAMIAAHSGAKQIDAFDIDEHAVEMAHENLRMNSLSLEQLICSDVASFSSKQYDYVAANLITHVLIEFKEKIFSFVKSGRFLALSGISLENMELIRQEFGLLDLTLLDVKQGEKWSAFLFQRN